MRQQEHGEHWGRRGHDGRRWWKERSGLEKAGLVLGGICLGLGLAILFGFIVVWLWNWLMPELFGLPRIGFWKAWGLVLLSAILFKGGGGNHSERHRRRRMRERMADIERECEGEAERGPAEEEAGG